MDDEVYQIFSRWSPDELNRVIQLADGDISRAIDSIIEHERTGIPLEQILDSRPTPHQASQSQGSQQQQSLAPTSLNQPIIPGMSTRGSRSVGPSFRSDTAVNTMYQPTAQLQEVNIINNLVDGRTQEYNQTFATGVPTRTSTTRATDNNNNNNNNNTTAPPPSQLMNEDTTTGYPTMPSNEHHAAASPQEPMQSLNYAAAVPPFIQVPERYNSLAGGAGGETRCPPYPMQGEILLFVHIMCPLFLVLQFHLRCPPLLSIHRYTSF